MSRTTSLFAGSALLAGVSAALLTGGIASADPAPAPAPAIPDMSAVPGAAMFQQFLDPAKAPQLLQAAAQTMTGGAPAATAPVQQPVQAPLLNVPGVTAPAATAPVQPVQAPLLNVPGVIAPAATTPGVPAQAPTTPAGSLLPSADITMPQVPGMPVPLPQSIKVPGDLGSLVPVANQVTAPATAPIAGVTAPITGAAAPIAGVVAPAAVPTVPGTPGVGSLSLISGLP